MSLKSLDELEAEVEAEEQLNNIRQSTLNQQTLEELWNEYAKSCESPSTRMILEQAQPILNADVIQVTVRSQLARGALMQETALLDLIRQATHATNILLQIEVIPEIKAEDTPQAAKTMSATEKLHYLISKNPLVENLVKDLHLKPEE
jgi:predicted RNA binding protein with dsRBD fold (UPF0201 family)